MTTSPRLGFTYLADGQAIPETAVNEIAAFLESASGHFIFKDRDLATPPGSPANGDCYLVAASATGAWAGQDGKIAYRLNTGWIFITVVEGYTAWVSDEDFFIGFDGAAWNTLAAPSGSYLAAANNLSDVASASTSRTNLGATTVGGNIFTLTDPSAITFLRVNANNSVSALSASAFRTAIGAGTGGGDLLAANNLSDVADAPTARGNLGLHAVTTQTGTSYTAVLADADSMVRFTNGSAVTFTIPPNSSVAFPVGTSIEIVQAGAGAVSVAAGSGVTINSRASDLTLAGQYAVAFVKKVATDTWIMNGDL